MRCFAAPDRSVLPCRHKYAAPPNRRLPSARAVSYQKPWEFDEPPSGIAGIGHAPFPHKREQAALTGRCNGFRRASGLSAIGQANVRAGSNRVGRVP